MVKNKLLEKLKETDPCFEEYCEEKITINRENFDNALMDVYGLNSDSPIRDIIGLTETATRLWNLLRQYHV